MCVAIPVKVKTVEGAWAEVQVSGGTMRVRRDLVDVKPGDYVLVHAGFVIQKLDPDEAEKTVAMLNEVRS